MWRSNKSYSTCVCAISVYGMYSTQQHYERNDWKARETYVMYLEDKA